MNRRRHASTLVALLALLSGCASPFADDDSASEPSDTLDRRLAERPEVVEDVDPVPTTAPPASGGDGGSTGSSVPAAPEGGTSPTSAPSPTGGSPDPAQPSSRVVGEQGDARGDHGIEGPDFADAIAVAIEERGDAARISVEFVAAVPERLGEDEVMGVGVDLYRPGNDDESRSDYQVFADGGPDGWYAYLQTPQGFVAYPGRFILSGRRMIWEVPWSAVGGLRAGAFRAFADWSGPGVAIVNKVSQDWAPNQGTSPFSR